MDIKPLEEIDRKRIEEAALNYVLRHESMNTSIEAIEQEAFKNGAEYEHNHLQGEIEELKEQNQALAESYSKLQLRFGESEAALNSKNNSDYNQAIDDVLKMLYGIPEVDYGSGRHWEKIKDRTEKIRKK